MDQLVQVLTKLKEQVLAISATKTVSVNMAVGHLIFYPNNTFEFKTIGTLNLNQKFNGKRLQEIESRGPEASI
jgi:hypothetical protein